MNGKKLKLWQKLGYGIGDFGANYCWTFVASFSLLYFTNVLGVSAAVIGTLMMFSKILDGITDVIAGRIIDRTHSKMGKARFWYFVSSFPTAFCIFLLFNVPAGFSDSTKYAYIFVVYTLMGAVFYTLSNIAYSSLTALVTKDPKERVELGSYRFIFAIIAVVLLSTFTSGLVARFGGGQTGWRSVSILYVVICLAALLIPFFSVHELPEEELNAVAGRSPESAGKKDINFVKSIGLLFRNKYFVIILLYYLFAYLSQGITQGLGIYYTTYCLNNASLLGAISFAGLLPTAFILPVIPKLSARYGLRKTAIGGGILAVTGGVLAYFSGMNGLLLPFMIGLVIKAVGSGPIMGGLNAFIASADDYSELKFGRRMTGMIYSCSSVGIKVGTGLGTALCGILLDSSGFNGKLQSQGKETILAIANMYLIATILTAVIKLIAPVLLNVESENKRLAAGREQAGRETA